MKAAGWALDAYLSVSNVLHRRKAGMDVRTPLPRKYGMFRVHIHHRKERASHV